MSLYIPGLAAPKDGCKSCMFDVYGQWVSCPNCGAKMGGTP